LKLPKETYLDQDRTHRLIPYRYSDRGRPILNLIAQNDDELLHDLMELEGATNDRLLGENGKLPGVSVVELVSGFRLAHIVNASFTHANPRGGRFNFPGRGAWYASFKMETAQREIAYHRSLELKEVGWTDEEVSPYIDYLADFRYEFHDLRGEADFVDCLDPHSYKASQQLGFTLLTHGSAGVVYPSVRHRGGVCLACFRPPLVLNVREGPMLTFTFRGGEMVRAVVNK
jgi:RES domain-containing protein